MIFNQGPRYPLGISWMEFVELHGSNIFPFLAYICVFGRELETFIIFSNKNCLGILFSKVMVQLEKYAQISFPYLQVNSSSTSSFSLLGVFDIIFVPKGRNNFCFCLISNLRMQLHWDVVQTISSQFIVDIIVIHLWQTHRVSGSG